MDATAEGGYLRSVRGIRHHIGSASIRFTEGSFAIIRYKRTKGPLRPIYGNQRDYTFVGE